ncbi:MAG: aldehyde dehydrogenase family protein, partial [Gemmatimonadaceae bacterium]
MTIATINPASGETLATYPALSLEQLEKRIERAAAAFVEWRRRPIAERAGVVARAGEILHSEASDFGRLMTTEMGKPLAAAVSEAEKCALGCRHYAAEAER